VPREGGHGDRPLVGEDEGGIANDGARRPLGEETELEMGKTSTPLGGGRYQEREDCVALSVKGQGRPKALTGGSMGCEPHPWVVIPEFWT
jgi:hypothetical protein